MAIAVDASTPARSSGSISAGGSQATASFTAPTDALLVACVSFDGDNDGHGGTCSVSDSGGLAWTERVTRTLSETTAGGGSCIHTARTTSSVSRTVSANRTGGSAGALRWTIKVYVLTGVDVGGTPVDSVTASNEGGSTTNSISTTNVTPGATGLLIVDGCEWNALGTPTSSNLTIDAHTAASLSGLSGYRTCTSGVATNGNLDASGAAAAQWKWTQIVVREAAATKAPPPLRRAGSAYRRFRALG